MKILLAIIFMIMLMSCTNQEQDQGKSRMLFLTKNDPIDNFWIWFDKNNNDFTNINDSTRDRKLDMILSELSKVQPELSIEISIEKNGITEMIISPEGDRDKFDIVKNIVNKAPKIKGWKITAFRQPIGFDFTLKYQNLRLAPSELYFIPILDKDSVDITIYGKGFKDYDYDTLSHYGLIMMDNVLGEYDCVTKVRYYDFKDISEVNNTSDLIPLKEIHEYIKRYSGQHQSGQPLKMEN